MSASSLQMEQIYRDYHSKVLGYLRSHLSDTQDAEDIASDIFMKIFEKLDSYDESKASLSTWIFTITRNTLTDRFRTRRVFEEIPETLADGSDIEEDLCNEETLGALAKALGSLEERLRDLVVMRYYQGLTLKEIAERMDISYAYVKVLHNKALSALRNVME